MFRNERAVIVHTDDATGTLKIAPTTGCRTTLIQRSVFPGHIRTNLIKFSTIDAFGIVDIFAIADP